MDKVRNHDLVSGRAATFGKGNQGAGFSGRYEIVARRPGENNRVLWIDHIDNRVVDEGLNYLLGAGLTAETQINTWHVLVSSGDPTIAVGDTAGSHAGWVEFTGLTGQRPVWQGSRSANRSATNPTAAQISMNATGTIGGAGLISVNSLGGSTGTLLSMGTFSAGDKVLNSGDTLDITATITNSSNNTD